MIILAASVVITLSNTGVIDRASQAVDLTNESQVQDLAALVWADAYMNGKRGTTLETEVTTKLSEQGVTSDKWNITVTDTGVVVKNKNSVATLGELITSAADYGKTVDYEANGITDWKVFYHTNDYVYLITSNLAPNESLPRIAGATITGRQILFPSDNPVTIPNKELWLANWGIYSGDVLNAVSYMLAESYWNGFKNPVYGTNVVGAIGSPTLEMFVESWNKKGQAKNDTTTYIPLTLSKSSYGYLINGEKTMTLPVTDDLYFYDLENSIPTVLAAPGDWGSTMFYSSIAVYSKKGSI